jgi:hypothetical protein
MISKRRYLSSGTIVRSNTSIYGKQEVKTDVDAKTLFPCVAEARRRQTQIGSEGTHLTKNRLRSHPQPVKIIIITNLREYHALPTARNTGHRRAELSQTKKPASAESLWNIVI